MNSQKGVGSVFTFSMQVYPCKEKYQLTKLKKALDKISEESSAN